MNKQLLARLEALEAKARQRKANKPADHPFPFGRLAVMMIAAGDPTKRVRSRWQPGRDSLLDAYARRCRYKGTAALWDAAFNDGATFARKHLAQDPCWTAPADIDCARQEILHRFAVEELCHQALEAVERAGSIDGVPVIDSGLPLPLSDCRPCRPD